MECVLSQSIFPSTLSRLVGYLILICPINKYKEEGWHYPYCRTAIPGPTIQGTGTNYSVGSLRLLDLCYTAPDRVERKAYRRLVLG
jgi:hypothetical protein